MNEEVKKAKIDIKDIEKKEKEKSKENKKKEKKKEKEDKLKNGVNTAKIAMFVVVIAIIVGLTIYLFPFIMNLSTPEGKVAFINMIEHSGIKGMAILFLLQIAQIFMFILPGEPLEIIAGTLYGAIGGMTFVLISDFIVTLLIVSMVKKFGRRFILMFFNEDQLEKIENNKYLKDKKQVTYGLLVLFLLPGTPKDLLTFVAGLFEIDPLKFAVLATFARIPSIISSTMVGAGLKNGNFTFSLIMYAVIVVIALLLGMIIGRGIKTKEKEDFEQNNIEKN